jgi:RNA polymerase sigma-19 factor, ECF subfamily
MSTERHRLAASLAEEFQASVVCKAQRMLRCNDKARDVAQEVFLRVLVARDLPDLLHHPKAWLARVTRNLCLNRLRDEARREEILLGLACEIPRPSSPERQTLLLQALSRARPGTREILELYFLHDLSHGDIAARLGISRRTVANRLAKVEMLG